MVFFLKKKIPLLIMFTKRSIKILIVLTGLQIINKTKILDAVRVGVPPSKSRGVENVNSPNPFSLKITFFSSPKNTL